MNTKTRSTVKVKIQLMAVVEGNKPSEQTEHLMYPSQILRLFLPEKTSDLCP